MKKYNSLLVALCIIYICIKVTSTMLSLIGAVKLFGLSLFTIPFLLAMSTSKPSRMIIIGLVIYVGLFVLTFLIFCLKRYKHIGGIGLVLLCVADFLCLSISFFLNPVNYKIIGAVFSGGGVAIAICFLLSIKRHMQSESIRETVF